ncbi:hypothetical protein GUITHDRAFT_137629 [Guillardia theta CCMP2712]|uniref:Major facilitator superfamily (MFS) profile domain-containing protein n=1 Tax=Guillardia theta (strain CCMP2712) TaxID=905079 RepID=L1JG48_GUITC|nr:hypothetical protein GUITHDRAFT_137629 [Guillardia theta CCMP2712]EKX47476.1 hypothetical protein GUITHDRAFT_137629 [Guillardia theta CCMP2712]|eukprot:XP_005834456.1 hypothetical protein GUITHDRAFT_137629 [Guillardia theta CCMP2712]
MTSSTSKAMEMKEASALQKRRGGSARAARGLLYLVTAIQGLCNQLLPSSFKVLESNLGLTPASLGMIAMAQAFFQSIAGPVWASLVDRGMSRKFVLVAGCMGWGLIAILLGCIGQLHIILLLRCLNGVALASLGPVAQSLVADITEPEQVGLVFGLLQFSMALGQGICATVLTSFSEERLSLGSIHLHGWQASFIGVGGLSILVAVAVVFFMAEFRNEEQENESSTSAQGAISEIRKEFTLLFSYFTIPSFLVILVQGMFGCIPWTAMSFLTMWFQYIGMSNAASGVLITMQIFASGVGGIVGGIVGDVLARSWSPFRGRPLAAQVSILSGLVLISWIFIKVPKTPDSFSAYAWLNILFGLTATWAGVACNQVVLLEVVTPNNRARISALLNCLNGAVAAVLGGPVVGFLAEMYGYRSPAKGTSISDLSKAERVSNLDALTTALLQASVPPWILTLACFSFLYWTYEKDVDKTRKEKAASTL